MPTNEVIHNRFAELAAQGAAIRVAGEPARAESQQFYTWASSALHLVKSVFGEQSSHFSRLNSEVESITHNLVSPRLLEACRGCFLGAKSDFDGGFTFHLERAISGEIFGDFVALAKTALSQGHHTVAAVLAAAALEDALKRYAIANACDVEGKSMEDVVNALKSKGLVSGAQKSLLGAMPKVRNFAMHADWDKLTPQDAGSIIGFVENFLLAEF